MFYTILIDEKNESPFGSSTLASKYPIGDSNTIISQSDSGVNPQFQKAQDPFGAYKDNIIYLFERADASTFMHETAHWFKKELKKFKSEKRAMMLKKVEEWEPNL